MTRLTFPCPQCNVQGLVSAVHVDNTSTLKLSGLCVPCNYAIVRTYDLLEILYQAVDCPQAVEQAT